MLQSKARASLGWSGLQRGMQVHPCYCCIAGALVAHRVFLLDVVGQHEADDGPQAARDGRTDDGQRIAAALRDGTDDADDAKDEADDAEHEEDTNLCRIVRAAQAEDCNDEVDESAYYEDCAKNGGNDSAYRSTCVACGGAAYAPKAYGAERSKPDAKDNGQYGHDNPDDADDLQRLLRTALLHFVPFARMATTHADGALSADRNLEAGPPLPSQYICGHALARQFTQQIYHSII